MNQRDGLRKRAEWLVTCLRLGWKKDDLPKLEKIWDEHHDKSGNLIERCTAEVR